MTNLFDIQGRKAIVTGATRGLGWGMAEGLMEAGAEVVIWGSSEKAGDVAEAFRQRGFACHSAAVNLADRESLRAGFARSLELLDPAIRREVFPAARPIHTKERNDASTYLDPTGACCNSLVADGCTIEGTVENSILFRGVSVAKGAEVKDCILMQDTTVSRDAVLQNVIADKDVVVKESCTLIGHANYPMTIAKGSEV